MQFHRVGLIIHDSFAVKIGEKLRRTVIIVYRHKIDVFMVLEEPILMIFNSCVFRWKIFPYI